MDLSAHIGGTGLSRFEVSDQLSTYKYDHDLGLRYVCLSILFVCISCVCMHLCVCVNICVYVCLFAYVHACVHAAVVELQLTLLQSIQTDVLMGTW